MELCPSLPSRRRARLFSRARPASWTAAALNFEGTPCVDPPNGRRPRSSTNFLILSTKRPLSDGPTYPKRVGLSVTIHSPLNHRARSRLHVAGTPNAPPRTHAPECPQPRARKPGRRAPRGLASQESLLNSLSCNELQTRTLQIMRETPVPVAVLPPVSFYRKKGDTDTRRLEVPVGGSRLCSLTLCVETPLSGYIAQTVFN